MKVKCENLVRCGNASCIHNVDGYYCRNVVISLDASGLCAFRRPKPHKTKPNTNPNPDPLEGSNAC